MRSEEDIIVRLGTARENNESTYDNGWIDALQWVLDGSPWRDAVSDPPKESGEYLVTDCEGMAVAMYDDGIWKFGGEELHHSEAVAFWMPLPPAPDGKGERNEP
jgi:hypothetical protein